MSVDSFIFHLLFYFYSISH